MADARISITAPSSAKEGAKVNASVIVKNITAFHYSFKGDISAVPDLYPHYVIGSIDQIIKSGESVTRNVSFTMPDCDVTVFIWLERWVKDHWAYVGSASKVVKLEIPAPPPPPPPVPPPPPEPVPPPPPPAPPPSPVTHIAFIDAIFSLVWDISAFFRDVAQSIPDWVDVYGWFSTPFYAIAKVFWDLLTPIAHFGEWADDVATKVQNVLTSEGILGLIKGWFPWLYDVGAWFTARWEWFKTAVGDWWDTKKLIVLGWIDIATEGLDALLVWWAQFWKITWPKWTATLEVLGSDVRDFFTRTLPTLVSFSWLSTWWKGKLFDIDGLIISKLKEWFPFYDDVAEFFKDPGEFLLSRLTDWFLGKEE